MAETSHPDEPDGAGETRRDFLYLATGAVAAVGVGAFAWPFIDAMNPAADTLALATIEVDLTPLQTGQSITVTWRGKPVFIRHQTEDEIAAARAVDVGALRDPATYEERTIKPEYLVQVGVCTHLGCIPLGQKATDAKGEFGGWFCPCHGSHYDTAGRIRKGPAPENLALPPYEFVDDTRIRIG